MISQIASVFVIGTAVWIISTDQMHKFHHAPAPVKVAVVAPIKVASIQPLPVKSGTTDAQAWHKALQEAAVLLARQ